MADLTNILAQELMDLEGIHSQHPETGAGINSGASYLDQYTNRIFGAPFQLLDSVDRRFPAVNGHVGNEYLRNFILNSPILHIKPGMPKYTGSTDSKSLLNGIKEIYFGTTGGNMSFAESLLTELAGGTVFSGGSKLQKRMFGFRETYYQYMSHVNYMCRSMATFLNLTSSSKFPNGTICSGSNGLQPFATMKWENYRMLTSATSSSPLAQLDKMASATLIGAAAKTVGTALGEIVNLPIKNTVTVAQEVAKSISGNDGGEGLLGAIAGNFAQAGQNIADAASNNFSTASNTTVSEVMSDKVCSVLFMVEPSQYEETLTNRAEPSAIENAMDAINNGIGQELAFITGSKADLGMIEGLTNFLGDTVTTAANFVNGLVEPVTGGFASNLFHGALRSVKGQKMIYPKIYKSSESEMSYQFTVKLNSPYGDVYNYYMNIVVPLMHLIALAAPRMITSNSVTSPFLVQAFIPGMCTCQLGIISNMTIVKNPGSKRVSVNGFPLEVEVRFTVQELYNSMSISPANDPASFLFNETLNDYMANLGGLQPSVDTYTRQRKVMFEGLNNYFSTGEFKEDLANNLVMAWEDFSNPFISNGS